MYPSGYIWYPKAMWTNGLCQFGIFWACFVTFSWSQFWYRPNKIQFFASKINYTFFVFHMTHCHREQFMLALLPMPFFRCGFFPRRMPTNQGVISAILPAILAKLMPLRSILTATRAQTHFREKKKKSWFFSFCVWFGLVRSLLQPKPKY